MPAAWRAIALLGVLLLSGCTGAPPEEPPARDGLALSVARVDLDGDGALDTINVTLLGADGPIEASRVALLLDGEALNVTAALRADAWHVGRGALLACAPGLHDLEVRIDGRARKLAVLECGVRATREPPLFQGRLLDHDGDGAPDTTELTLLSGGPLRREELSLAWESRAARLYDGPAKASLLRKPLVNASKAYAPCSPASDQLTITWRNTTLPALSLSGGTRWSPGIDAPLRASVVDVDADGRQDGWRLELGPSEDAPLVMASIAAAWGEEPTRLTNDTAFAPTTDLWHVGQAVIATCHAEGSAFFFLRASGTLVFQSVTICEEPPGRPLLELELAAVEGGLAARLLLSRPGPLVADEVFGAESEPIGRGLWAVNETRVLPCPSGRLLLTYRGATAYDGPAPC